jgi:hypothetical protein
LQVAQRDVLVDRQPSTWWNCGVWVASESGGRRGPGSTTYSGRLGLHRADCIGEVCVRRTTSSAT